MFALLARDTGCHQQCRSTTIHQQSTEDNLESQKCFCKCFISKIKASSKGFCGEMRQKFERHGHDPALSFQTLNGRNFQRNSFENVLIERLRNMQTCPGLGIKLHLVCFLKNFTRCCNFSPRRNFLRFQYAKVTLLSERLSLWRGFEYRSLFPDAAEFRLPLTAEYCGAAAGGGGGGAGGSDDRLASTASFS